MASGGAVHPVEVEGAGGAAEVVALVVVVLAAIAFVVVLWRRWHVPSRARLADLGDGPEAGGRPDPITPMTLLIGGMLLWITAQLFGGGAYAVLGTLHGGGGEEPPAMWLGASAGLVGQAAVLGALALLIALLPPMRGAIGLVRFGRGALAGVVGFLVVAPIITVVGWGALFGAVVVRRMIGAPPPDPIAHETLRGLASDPGAVNVAVVGLAVVVGAPVFEEVVYRGFLQSSLLRASRSPLIAILLTSLVFTSAHIGVADAMSLLVLFAFSVMLGLAFERSRSLAAPIVMHALFNAMNVGMVLI